MESVESVTTMAERAVDMQERLEAQLALYEDALTDALGS